MNRIIYILLIMCVTSACIGNTRNDDAKEDIVKFTPLFIAKVQQYNQLGDFHDGFAIVSKTLTNSEGKENHISNYIDLDGNELLDVLYNPVSNFQEGFAVVSKDNKCGFIDTKGDLVIPCIYDLARSFSDGLAPVNNGKKWGYINKEGEIIIPFCYDEVEPFSEGLAAVRNGNKYSYINKENVAIYSSQFSEDHEVQLTEFTDDLAIVLHYSWGEYDKYYTVINNAGKVLFSGEFAWGGGSRASIFDRDPAIINGEIYIPQEPNGEETIFDVYNLIGTRLRAEKGLPTDNKLSNHKIYTKIENPNLWFEDGEQGGYSNITFYGLQNLSIEGLATKEVTAPIYSHIYELNNGIARVSLTEYDENAFIEGPIGDINPYYNEKNTYYGYADLYGNDTFSTEIKNRCRQSLTNAIEKKKEYDKEQCTEPSWLQGTWKSVVLDNHRRVIDYMYTIFYNGKITTYFKNSTITHITNYTIESGNIKIGKGGYMNLDRDKEIVIGADGTELTKYSNSTTIDNTLQSVSNGYSSYQNQTIAFHSPTSVIDYLHTRTFSGNGITINVRFDGIYLNGRCMSAAPIVENYNSSYAVISAQGLFNNGRFIIRVYPTQDKIVDNSSGQAYYCD